MSFILDLTSIQKPFVLCTVIKTSGSAPGKAGFKMIVQPDGHIIGTVGGGDVEHSAIESALQLFEFPLPSHTENFILNQKWTSKNKQGTAKKAIKKTAMICGGESEIFFELFQKNKEALLFGGGHIAQSLAPLLQNLDFDVSVYDNRKKYATKDKYPVNTKIITGTYRDITEAVEVDDSSYCFIFTHGHAHDRLVLETLLRKPKSPKYIGMIGSREKIKETLKALQNKGISKTKLNQVYTPIGLSTGGDTPFEIAIAIAAEALTIKYGREGGHMRNRR